MLSVNQPLALSLATQKDHCCQVVSNSQHLHINIGSREMKFEDQALAYQSRLTLVNEHLSVQ